MTNEAKIRAAVASILTEASFLHVYQRDIGKCIDDATKAVMETGLVEEIDKASAKPLVTRVELIRNSTRDRVLYDVRDVSTALQDEGRTLKVFLRDKAPYDIFKEGDQVRHKILRDKTAEVYERNNGGEFTRVVWDNAAYGTDEPVYWTTEDLELVELAPQAGDRVELAELDDTYAFLTVGVEGCIMDWWKDRDEVLVEFLQDDEDIDVLINKNKLKRSVG